MTDEHRSDEHSADTTKPAPEEQRVETTHTVTIDGRQIRYRATAGTLVLEEEREEDDVAKGAQPAASVFYVAYQRLPDEDQPWSPDERPITFSFNGGPGSSSVWLHLGLLGPRRVVAAEEDRPAPPPGRRVDNAYSLLDVTDLVFVDPVSTGYSRVVPGETAETYHSIEQDIASVGEFIRLFTTRFERWASPKFVIGESYGTTRAAGLSGHLADTHGLYLNGIMLVSSVLDFQTLLFETANDLPYVLFLPTYTATAWYHGRLEEALQADLRRTLDEVEQFALGDYLLALAKGAELADDERGEIATRLARYTGLSEDFVRRADLRVSAQRFFKELLRENGRTVGRLDSRFTGIDRDAAGETPSYDPSYAVIQGPYTAALNDYVRRELGFESDLPYEILTDRVRPWKWEGYENRYVNVAETLRQAMTKNPFLKVLVANGYYDLATPYFATEYTVRHLGLDPTLRDNIRLHDYEAGHMMYVHELSLAAMREDLVAFIDDAVSSAGR